MPPNYDPAGFSPTPILRYSPSVILSAIVAAGGAGVRFGGDKTFAEVRGAPLRALCKALFYKV